MGTAPSAHNQEGFSNIWKILSVLWILTVMGGRRQKPVFNLRTLTWMAVTSGFFSFILKTGQFQLLGLLQDQRCQFCSLL